MELLSNPSTLSVELHGTVGACLSTRGSASLQGTHVCWNTGLLEAPSQTHLPSMLSSPLHSLCHSHLWCQMPKPVGLLLPSSSPSSAHWLLKATPGLGWCWEWGGVGGTDADPGAVSEGSAWVLVARGSPMSPGDPSREDFNSIPGIPLKSFMWILEWLFGVESDVRSILPGRIHLDPNTFLSVEEVKLRPNGHSSAHCLRWQTKLGQGVLWVGEYREAFFSLAVSRWYWTYDSLYMRETKIFLSNIISDSFVYA